MTASDSAAPQTVLIVDDIADNRQALNDLLKNDYTILLAKNGEQALDRAARQLPDLILLDIMMPGMSGYEVLSRLQQCPSTEDIPVIFITGLDSPEDEAKGLLHGAVDYIAKPFNPATVHARVNAHMHLARQRKLLEDMAEIDRLTGLASRRYFDQVLAREWLRAKRENKELALVWLDVDGLRDYNVAHTSAMGDRILGVIAAQLQGSTHRVTDLVARYEDDEFVLLLPDTHHEGVAKIARQLQDAVAQQSAEQMQRLGLPGITASVSTATSMDADFAAPEALVEHLREKLANARKPSL